MAKRVKKRWESMAEIPPLSEEDKREITQGIESALDRAPSPPCITEVILASRLYLCHKLLYNEQPRLGDIRKTLSALHKRVRPLVEVFEQLDDAARMWFVRDQGYTGPIPEFYTEGDRKGVKTPAAVFDFLVQFEKDLIALDFRLANSLRAFSRNPDRDGAPADVALNEYIQRLAQIYHAETGKKAAMSRGRREDGTRVGQFMRLLEACLTLLDKELCQGGNEDEQQKKDRNWEQRVYRALKVYKTPAKK